jgi:amino acid permease
VLFFTRLRQTLNPVRGSFGQQKDTEVAAHNTNHAMAQPQSADENKIVPVTVDAGSPENENKPFAVAKNGNVIDNGLQRGLKNRHLVMISFGGVVGASIW